MIFKTKKILDGGAEKNLQRGRFYLLDLIITPCYNHHTALIILFVWTIRYGINWTYY